MTNPVSDDEFAKRIIQVVRIESGRHPLQVFMLGLTAFSGLSYLVSSALGVQQAPNPVQSALPRWLIFGWSLLLFIGPILALVGTFWQSRTLSGLITGLILQKRGLFVTGVGAFIYTTLLFRYTIPRGIIVQAILSGSILIAYSVACFVRIRHINRDLKGFATSGTVALPPSKEEGN